MKLTTTMAGEIRMVMMMDGASASNSRKKKEKPRLWTISQTGADKSQTTVGAKLARMMMLRGRQPLALESNYLEINPL